ncbi:MAG: hypothetical protein M0P58_13505, partial [Bacteroidales bacterium]|nr:hypothetical protein [Bacteroidales bacterium]
FITLKTKNGEPLFGLIENGTMILNEFGKIIEDEWLKTPVIRSYVHLDEYVIMPEHFHGIIELSAIADVVGATRRVAPTTRERATPTTRERVAPTRERVAPTTRERAAPTTRERAVPTTQIRPNGPKPGSIGAIIGQFKMQTTKRINRIRFSESEEIVADVGVGVGATRGSIVGATRRVAPTTPERVAPTISVWQRDYYDRIIRNNQSLITIRNYIRKNPERYKNKG